MQAVILAGGMSRRLGGTPKAGLLLNGQTLLARTLDAATQLLGAEAARGGASEARRGAIIAVVGPVEAIQGWLETSPHRHLVAVVQEEPTFSGPAAGIAAGLAVLDARDGHVLVLACDMPHAAQLLTILAKELDGPGSSQGVMAVDGGRKQPLAAIYPERALRDAVAEAAAAHRLENASVFSLLASVRFKECAVPAGLAADIDTWEDARAQGIASGPTTSKE